MSMVMATVTSLINADIDANAMVMVTSLIDADIDANGHGHGHIDN